MKKQLVATILAGDIIRINNCIEGVVAFSSITDSYSEEYPKEHNSGDENDGILIVQKNGARIFHDTEFLISGDCNIEVLGRDAS